MVTTILIVITMMMMMMMMMMITLSPCGQHKHSVVPCKDSSQNRGFNYNAVQFIVLIHYVTTI